MRLAGKSSYSQLHRWSIESSADFWELVWRFGQVRGEPGLRRVINPERMPGAKWFPEGKLNYAENLLRERDATPAIVFWGEDRIKRHLSKRQLYDLVSRIAQALADAGVKKGDRVAGYLPNVPEATAALLASGEPGGGVVELLAGLRRAGRARPLRADRAQDSVLRRRLSLWRQGVRLAGEGEPGAGQAAQRRGMHRDRLPRRAGERRHLAPRFPRAFRPAGHQVRAGGVQPPALHPLFLGHHRGAEVHRARHRRRTAAAPEGASPAQRRQGRRPPVLFHYARLDDVELARVRARFGRDASALRRLAFRGAGQAAVRSGRRRGHDAFRHLGKVHRRHRQGRSQAKGDPPPRAAARRALDRLAAGAGGLRLHLPEREERRVPLLDLRGHGHRVLLRPGQPHGVRLAWRDPGQGTGHGGRGVR